MYCFVNVSLFSLYFFGNNCFLNFPFSYYTSIVIALFLLNVQGEVCLLFLNTFIFAFFIINEFLSYFFPFFVLQYSLESQHGGLWLQLRRPSETFVEQSQLQCCLFCLIGGCFTSTITDLVYRYKRRKSILKESTSKLNVEYWRISHFKRKFSKLGNFKWNLFAKCYCDCFHKTCLGDPSRVS